MNAKKQFKELYRTARRSNLCGIYWLAQQIDYEYFQAVSIALKSKVSKKRPLQFRLFHYKYLGELAPKSYRC